jgi:hypothetical protein
MQISFVIGLVAIAGSTAIAQPPAASPSPMPAAAPSPSPSSTVSVYRSGPLFGIELGIGAGNRFQIIGVDGQLGWTFQPETSLFATASLGVLGAAGGAFYGTLGGGVRVWSSHGFVDARIERMGAAAMDCDDCSSRGANRYTVAVGVEPIAGPHGGMLLSLKAMLIAEFPAIVLSIGSYGHR